jgi:hypothetical protein
MTDKNIEIDYNNLDNLPDHKTTDEFLFDIHINSNPEVIILIVNNLLYKGIKHSKRGIMYAPKLEMELHNKLLMKSFDQLCYEFFESKLSKTSEDLLSIIGKELRKKS